MAAALMLACPDVSDDVLTQRRNEIALRGIDECHHRFFGPHNKTLAELQVGDETVCRCGDSGEAEVDLGLAELRPP